MSFRPKSYSRYLKGLVEALEAQLGSVASSVDERLQSVETFTAALTDDLVVAEVDENGELVNVKYGTAPMAVSRVHRSDISAPGAVDGTISVEILENSGETPFTYRLERGGELVSSVSSDSRAYAFSGLAPGAYRLQITDSAAKPAQFVQEPLDLITSVTLAGAAQCEDCLPTVKLVASLEPGTGTGPFTYSVLLDGVTVAQQSSSERSVEFFDLAEGCYIVRVEDSRGGVSAMLTPVCISHSVSSVVAAGGEVEEIDGWRMHSFKATGTSQLTVATGGPVDILLVGGGGGGGRNHISNNRGGGGGGGGGVVYIQGHDLSPGTYDIVVGGGGAGGSQTGVSGGASSFGGLFEALGGGGGGGAQMQKGLDGGSGGGGGGESGTNGFGQGVPGQGNRGGFSTVGTGGSGGGAGGPGRDAFSGTFGWTRTAAPGSALGIDLGERRYFSAGGNGGSHSTNANMPDSPANTGFGGHGARIARAGAGGSGIVIVRYRVPALVTISSVTANGVSSPTSADGSLEVSITAGTPPFRVTLRRDDDGWIQLMETDARLAAFSELRVGFYTIEVQDGAGASATEPVTVGKAEAGAINGVLTTMNPEFAVIPAVDDDKELISGTALILDDAELVPTPVPYFDLKTSSAALILQGGLKWTPGYSCSVAFFLRRRLTSTAAWGGLMQTRADTGRFGTVRVTTAADGTLTFTKYVISTTSNTTSWPIAGRVVMAQAPIAFPATLILNFEAGHTMAVHFIDANGATHSGSTALSTDEVGYSGATTIETLFGRDAYWESANPDTEFIAITAFERVLSDAERQALHAAHLAILA